MGGLPSTVSIESILENPIPRKSVVVSLKKNMTEAVTRDMASSDWLKLAASVCFARKVYLKINPFVTVLGQDRKGIDQHTYLIHS